MQFSQSALFFYLSFQFLILRLLITTCTHFHHLFFGRPLSRLPWGLLLITWITFLLLSVLLTWPIQFNRLILTNENISNFQTAALIVVSLSPIFIYFNSTNTFLKTFLSKAANRFSHQFIQYPKVQFCPALFSLNSDVPKLIEKRSVRMFDNEESETKDDKKRSGASTVGSGPGKRDLFGPFSKGGPARWKIRVREFKPGRSRWIFRASEKSSPCLPSEGKWKNLSHVPALRHVKEPSAFVSYECASKIPCIAPSFASRGLSCLCGTWRLWRWMRGTHWGQGYNRPTGCSAEKAPHATPNLFFLHRMRGFVAVLAQGHTDFAVRRWIALSLSSSFFCISITTALLHSFPFACTRYLFYLVFLV